MLLMINHQTSYGYDFPVQGRIQYLRMTPRTRHHQQVLDWQVSAGGDLVHQTDGFGNVLSCLTLNQPHQTLLIQAQGRIRIDAQADYVRDEQLNPLLFQAPSELTHADDALWDFAHTALKRCDRAGLVALAGAILEHMPYTPQSTAVGDSASQTFALGRGVCQDHTPVKLACARARGLPARYVSGYLYTDSDEHLASHAWAEVYLEGKWYCFDVSNQLFSPVQHVQVAVGRDYLDAAPSRGMRQGGGEETMQATVQVRCESAASVG